MSAGAVQRCFATRAELLRFVLQHINVRFTARVTARMARQPDPADETVGLRVVIDEMLPVDAERRLTSAATLALLAYSATEPQAAEVMRAAYTGAHTFFTRAFTAESAIGLYAVITGLQGPLIVGAITPEQAWSVVDAAIAGAARIGPGVRPALQPPDMTAKTDATGTGPAHRESFDLARLSPMTNTASPGTATGPNRRGSQEPGFGGTSSAASSVTYGSSSG